MKPRKSGRPRGARDPRLSIDESRRLLHTLGDGATAIAARLGVTRQAVDRALRTGLSVRMARRWNLIDRPDAQSPEPTPPPTPANSQPPSDLGR